MATGELRTAAVLRRADRAEYIFTAMASDRGAAPRSTSAIVRVQVPTSSWPCTPASLVPVPSTPRLASWKTPSSYLAAFLPASSSSTTFIPGHPLLLFSC